MVTVLIVLASLAVVVWAVVLGIWISRFVSTNSKKNTLKRMWLNGDITNFVYNKYMTENE
jgi:hypothetical protein